MSPEEKANNIAYKEKLFKEAVRWLLEVEKFNNNYGDDTWRDDGLAEISDVAQHTYKEAIRAVIEARKELKKARLQ